MACFTKAALSLPLWRGSGPERCACPGGICARLVESERAQDRAIVLPLFHEMGLIGFILASLACGLSPTIWVLIGARIVQGAAAAMLVPQVLATCHATLDDGEGPDGSPELQCSGCALAYRIDDGIPVLLVDEARTRS